MNTARKKKSPWAGMSKAARSAEMKRRRAKSIDNQQEVRSEAVSQEAIAYAFGYVQAWLHSYSERLGVSQHAVTQRVGKFLQSASGR